VLVVLRKRRTKEGNVEKRASPDGNGRQAGRGSDTESTYHLDPNVSVAARPTRYFRNFAAAGERMSIFGSMGIVKAPSEGEGSGAWRRSNSERGAQACARRAGNSCEECPLVPH
jgi:hypothetical protein